MVIDAVGESPTVVPSRTAHIQTRGQSQTPRRRAPSGSETDSDRAEMDLISRSFKRTSAVPGGESTQMEMTTGQRQPEPESVGYSSQDTTLHEMREQALGATREGRLRPENERAIKNSPGKASLCEKNSSQRLAGPSHSSLALQTPSTILT